MASARSHLRTPLKAVSLFLFWALTPFVPLWIGDWIDFMTSRPRALQTRLLGEPIGDLGSLHAIRNDCCALNGDGVMRWTYTLPSATRQRLAQRCIAPREIWTGHGSERDPHGCILRQLPDPAGDIYGFSLATLQGDKLVVEQWWM